MTQSRYILGHVVDFATIEFGGEFGAAKKKPSANDRKIRRLLRRARKLKTRIRHLQIRQPLGWKGALKTAKTNLKVVMSDLKEAGWKPKKATRAKKPGEDDEDAQLDDIPEAEPGEKDDIDDDDIDEIPDVTTQGNWLDRHVGIEGARPKKNLWKEAGKLFTPKWGPQKPLGDAARIQAKGGNQVMVRTCPMPIRLMRHPARGARRRALPSRRQARGATLLQQAFEGRADGPCDGDRWRGADPHVALNGAHLSLSAGAGWSGRDGISVRHGGRAGPG